MDSEEHAGCPVDDCKIPVDLILQSSDGIQLGAHKVNLQTFSDGFPLAESVEGGDMSDVPILEESSDVLRLMLRFMHNAPMPDLDDVPFMTVAALVDAAEKYLMFSAIAVCKLYMLEAKDRHPVEVFAYACKHGYMNIADKTALLVVDEDATTMAAKLDPGHLLKWFLYRETWVKKRWAVSQCRGPTLDDVEEYGFNLHLEDCKSWGPFVSSVKSDLSRDKGLVNVEKMELEALEDELDRLRDCSTCMQVARAWIRERRYQSSRSLINIPRFSEV